MPKTLAERVEQAIKDGGVAITTITIGDAATRSTWRVRPVHLQSAAQPIIDAFTEPTPNTLLEEDADEKLLSDKRFKAVIDALWEAIPNPLTTKQATRARAKQLYKNGNGA